MLKNVALSGVILTRTLSYGSPYLVINYDDLSGSTDSITGGDGTDTLKLSNANAVTLSSAGAAQTAFKAAVTGFETLDITAQTGSTVAVGALGTFNTVDK